MAFESRITAFLNKRKWIIPALFATMCVLFVALLIQLLIRDFNAIHPRNAFSIGGELASMLVAIMMTLSILPSYRRDGSYNRIFVGLLTLGCFSLYFDSQQMIYDGDPAFSTLNMVVSVFIFSNSALYLFFFWLYANSVLKSTNKIVEIINIIAGVLMFINVIAPYFNFIQPFYFHITEAGSFERLYPGWIFSQNYVVFIIIALIIAIVLSKEKVRTKLVITAFSTLPIIAIVVSGYANVPEGEPTVTVQYSAMMASLVLIYSFLFSDNEKNLYSTNRELGIATNIQKHMLPSIFPAFPERKEFDIYASMDPAKEVGGDFYDFFLIDDTHLGIVMADVSDKGIPAALFMMACKIMVKNYAMLGQTPKQVITSVNKQICANNQEGMFVTIWLGILDLETGLMTACNAGHEKPVVKHPNGDFEIMADPHSFIVGWNEVAVYKEYEIQLQKGSKLFLYTDGVPESNNGNSQFGNERMLESLVTNESSNPQTICEEMTKSIALFVGKQDQFDDTTMLCFEYKGYEDE